MVVYENTPDGQENFVECFATSLYYVRVWIWVGAAVGFCSGLVWPFYVGRFIGSHLTQFTH
jgi:hypothetical protein